jgi:Acetyltransferase (GNAT) domain
MQARFFRDADAERWDAFCASAYGATFLHTRRFLSYHGDRFIDRSVVIEDGEQWLGVMPAARHPQHPERVVSHPGITYGGMVHQGQLRGGAMLAALASSVRLLHEAGFESLEYKVVPYIYHRAPAQDDLYALHRLGASASRCDLSCCVDLLRRLPVSQRRERGVKKATRSGIEIETGLGTARELWAVLEDNLQRRHGVQPTHAIDEILTLAKRFPVEIDFVVARLDAAVLAGVVLFRGGPTVHAQYIASTEAGAKAGALDLVFESCIERAQADGARYFDFGISTEAHGAVLNDGLYRFKSEFGGSGVVHQFFELNLEGAAHADR